MGGTARYINGGELSRVASTMLEMDELLLYFFLFLVKK